MSDAVLPRRPADPQGPDHDPARGRWIPWCFVAAFAVIITVNGIMAYFAVSTFTGVTVTKPYERGRNYNHVLEEAARQDALGWTSAVTVEAGRLLLSVSDRDGRAVEGRVEGALHRPLDRTALPLDFVALGGGRYLAALEATAHGQWDVRATLEAGQGRRLDIRHRVTLR